MTNISEETAEIIGQIENWYNAKIEQLNIVVSAPDGTPLMLQSSKGNEPLKVDDPKLAKGIKLGMSIAAELMGQFPVKLTRNDDDEHLEA